MKAVCMKLRRKKRKIYYRLGRGHRKSLREWPDFLETKNWLSSRATWMFLCSPFLFSYKRENMNTSHLREILDDKVSLTTSCQQSPDNNKSLVLVKLGKAQPSSEDREWIFRSGSYCRFGCCQENREAEEYIFNDNPLQISRSLFSKLLIQITIGVIMMMIIGY